MNKALATATLVLVAFLSAGCATRASLAAAFRSDRDECVGKIFMDRTTWWCRWSDAIARRQVDAGTDEYEIAMEDIGKCRWIYVVDRESQRVTGWRYAGGQEDCYNRIDYLGVW